MALKGIKVIELGGLAPAPYCGKILADFGATVLKVSKPRSPTVNFLDSNKKSVLVDIKKSAGVSIVKRLCSSSDVLIDPFRPGVLERVGLGPKDLMKENPRLIYARITGYGQSGPMNMVAGHDINYVAMSGMLSMLGRKDMLPTPPINLLADFAGGGLMCAFGVAMALLHRSSTGVGQVVDNSMSEGVGYVSSFIYAAYNSIFFANGKGNNILDSGAHYYNTYETKDGRYMAVGAIEPQFYEALLKGLKLTEDDVAQSDDFEKGKAVLTKRFKEKTMQEWTEIFSGTDACVSPVLTFEEAFKHPHNVARGSFTKVGNELHSSPAPKLTSPEGGESYNNPPPQPPPTEPGENTEEILKEVGYSDGEINELLQRQVVFKLESKL